MSWAGICTDPQSLVFFRSYGLSVAFLLYHWLPTCLSRFISLISTADALLERSHKGRRANITPSCRHSHAFSPLSISHLWEKGAETAVLCIQNPKPSDSFTAPRATCTRDTLEISISGLVPGEGLLAHVNSQPSSPPQSLLVLLPLPRTSLRSSSLFFEHRLKCCLLREASCGGIIHSFAQICMECLCARHRSGHLGSISK